MSNTFKDFALREPILRALDEAGYTEPTPIQEQAIPILMDGSDLLGVAQTGTGKTLAFLLPILQQVDGRGTDPVAVVICPTRELAIQVAGEAERFGGHLGVRVVLAYGGTSSGSQKRALAEGCDLVVATPGRLLDFVNSAWLSLRRIRFVVLDEADRMLDMGFIDDVDAILRRTPMSRQTMLFSATIPEAIRNLSQRYMFHPQTVRVGGDGTRVKETIDHALYPVSPARKVDLLLEVLDRERPTKTLIFTATRETTSRLALPLRRRGHDVVSLSSLLSQSNRERALAAFRKGEFRVLVATDVAARGLDITDIDMVVNFDVPMHAEDYVHRIGRTGRAERSGKAVTLVTGEDRRRIGDIERLLGYAVPRIELEEFDYGPPEQEHRGRGRARSRERGGRRRRRKGAANRAAKPRRRKGPPRGHGGARGD
ncbi:MAG: DEAD/DEAH box helicase [Acidobacteriota bacterium]|nr:DEAD/DEAH box helicase [Acidobacteriota bacterium]